MKATHKYELEQISGARILLVEDILINQLVASKMLVAVGMDITVANNGQEALDKLNELNNCDLIFMDLHMPIMDGYTASLEIRKNKTWDQIPIIAMSADLQDEIKERCLEVGMNGLVSKPVDAEMMHETLIKWIEPRHHQVVKSLPLNTNNDNETKLPHIKYININSALKRINQDKSLLQKLLISFYDSNKTFLNDVSDAFNSGEIEKADRLVHTIKGVSGNIGANELYEASIELERNLKAKLFKDIQEILHPYSLILNPLLEELRQFKQSLQEEEITIEDITPLEEIDKEALDTMVKTLRQLLNENDMEAKNLIVKLKKVKSSTDFHNKLITIENALKNYDFDEALNVANAIAA